MMAGMKLALLSDIHANLRALQACLDHAHAEGATRYALLGDLVGYGAEPAAVVDTAIELATAGATVLRGNHDDLAVTPPTQASTTGDQTAAWTHAQLDAGQRRFLAGLPLTAALGSALLVHASADAPADWHYVDNAQRAARSLDGAGEGVRHVLGGHVHHQRLYYRGSGRGLMEFVPTPGVAVPVPLHRQWLATVGSVGQPRDGDTRAMYALFDAAQCRLTFHRVGYDHRAAAAAVRRAGQPEYFASRLEEGR
jgi:predicted phosphodiesterase